MKSWSLQRLESNCLRFGPSSQAMVSKERRGILRPPIIREAIVLLPAPAFPRRTSLIFALNTPLTLTRIRRQFAPFRAAQRQFDLKNCGMATLFRAKHAESRTSAFVGQLQRLVVSRGPRCLRLLGLGREVFVRFTGTLGLEFSVSGN